MIRFLYIITILALFSCTKDDDKNYYDDDQFIFTNVDTLLFHSQENTDSFLIEKKFNSNIFEVIYYQKYFGRYYKEFWMKISPDPDKRNPTLSWETESVSLFFTYKDSKMFVIHDLVINSVYERTTNQRNFLFDYEIKRAFFCKQLGLIQYETFKGDVYKIDKKTLYDYTIINAISKAICKTKR